MTDVNPSPSISNDNNNPQVFCRPVFGARMVPSSIHRRLGNPYRSALLQNIELEGVAAEVAVINESLTRGMKIRLEDAFITDAIIRRGITLFAKFLLGKRTKTAIDVNKEFMDVEKQEAALAVTFSEQEVSELRTLIDKVNRKVNFRDKIEAGVIQCLIGGRSVLLVEKERGGMPADLKVLNWGKLGRTFVDKDTWQLVAVEYADRKKEEPLLAEDIIHFSWHDYHVAPDSLYQGLSAILPVGDASETIRLITSEDLKESSRTAWASSGVIKFPPNTSQTKITEFLAGFVPGTWNGTSQSVEVEEHDLQPKLEALTNVVEYGQRWIQRGLGIPAFLMGFEQIANRATAELVMNSWRESDLNHARSWLQGILEPQWFDSLISLRFPDINIDDMWIKAKLEFEDVTFESLKDRSEAVLPLFQAGVIPLEKVLKILDMEDVLEQMLAEQKRLERQRKEELEMMRIEQQQRQQQQQQPVNGNGNSATTSSPAPKKTTSKEEEEDDDEEKTKSRSRRGSSVIDDRILFQNQMQEMRQAAMQDNAKNVSALMRLKETEHKLRVQLLEKQSKVIDRLDKQIEGYESNN